MKRLPALKGRLNPCLHCPHIEQVASMEKVIAVGFGAAYLSCDGKVVVDGEAKAEKGKPFTFADAERRAAKKPRSDWRVVLNGPLHGETY